MRRLTTVFVCIAALLCVMSVSAKKYKWVYNSHVCEVYTIGQGKNHTQLVKAWAVAKNADKAIVQAKMDAVTAALFSGIGPDEKTHGMGTANLSNPLVSGEVYSEHEALFNEFFKKGEFLKFVKDVNSSYPSGENNMACPGGRRVGVNLILDYAGLRKWLEENGVKKGLGGHFHNN